MNSKWPKSLPLSGIASALLFYDMAAATEAPRRARWRCCNKPC